jgi:hypothetical protein
MRQIAEKIGVNYEDESAELFELADELRRRSGSRAPAASTTMNPELEEEIRDYAEANPDLPQHTVAEKFNVNPGRVSETLRGKRE